MTSVGVAAEVLLCASRLGLTDGQRAFIYVDTRTPLNATSELAMSVPYVSDRSVMEVNSSRTRRLMTAAQALLILEAHAASLTADAYSNLYKVPVSFFFQIIKYYRFFRPGEIKVFLGAVANPGISLNL